MQYLDLARDLFSVESPALIAIGGLSGTGKSTIARLLAYRLGQRRWPLVLRSDVIRKHLSGVEPTTLLGPDAYSSSRSADVYRHLCKRAETLLRAGRTVIVDATFLDPAERIRIETLADDLDVPFQGIWLNAPRNILERRIQERHGDASDADVDVLTKQLEHDLGDMTWMLVDTGKCEMVALSLSKGGDVLIARDRILSVAAACRRPKRGWR